MTKKPTYEQLEKRVHELERSEFKRKLAEEVLRDNEQFMISVFESIQDGISVLNPDLSIRHVNSVMKKWYLENLPLEGKKCFE
jgi:PAS domain-containing protein